MLASGGAYPSATRRKYFITGPQWAAAYQGQALFHAPTRQPIGFEEVIREYAKIGIGYWCTHDTDVIPTEQLGKDGQKEIVSRIQKSLAEHGLKCSMVTTETFHHAVFAASPAAEAPEVREYARMVGLNPEYPHELMWGGAPRAALARALLAGKLWHFDINDGYRLKHDVDIGVGLVNPLDWLNVLVLLRSHGYNGPFNLDFKPPRTTSNWGVFAVSFPSAVDRFITLWEIAGEVQQDAIIKEASEALQAGAGVAAGADADAIAEANKELLTLHELIAHRLVQLLLGLHRGRTFVT
jgi:hypothetical protein